MFAHERMVSSGDATTMLLDGLGRLCCSAHGEHMSWTPFTGKPRQLRVPAGADGKETAHPGAGQFSLSSTSLVSAVAGPCSIGRREHSKSCRPCERSFRASALCGTVLRKVFMRFTSGSSFRPIAACSSVLRNRGKARRCGRRRRRCSLCSIAQFGPRRHLLYRKTARLRGARMCSNPRSSCGPVTAQASE